MGRIQTTFLTASASFLTGMGTVGSVGGNFYGFNSSPSVDLADQKALFADWALVGQDLRDVMAAKCAPSTPECLTK
jgi:hypothetical protein